MEDREAPYSVEELAKLRSRWKKPLWDHDQEKQVEVEGCKTYEELLRHGLSEIAKIFESYRKDRPEKPSMVDGDALSKLWDLLGKDTFFRTLLMLKLYGLDDYLPASATDEFLHRPCSIDMRGAECVEAHFEGANCREVISRGQIAGGLISRGQIAGGPDFDGAECWGSISRRQIARG